jgi:hypothetical protein
MLAQALIAAERAGTQPQPTAVAGKARHRPSHDQRRDVRPWSRPDRPSVEVVVPIEPAGTGRCADQARYRSQAQVMGLERLELQTSAAIPPANLGC